MGIGLVIQGPAHCRWSKVRDQLPGFYLHDNDECQLGSQNVPELHGVGVLLLMAGRVSVITVPAKTEHVRE